MRLSMKPICKLVALWLHKHFFLSIKLIFCFYLYIWNNEITQLPTFAFDIAAHSERIEMAHTHTFIVCVMKTCYVRFSVCHVCHLSMRWWKHLIDAYRWRWWCRCIACMKQVSYLHHSVNNMEWQQLRVSSFVFDDGNVSATMIEYE